MVHRRGPGCPAILTLKTLSGVVVEGEEARVNITFHSVVWGGRNFNREANEIMRQCQYVVAYEEEPPGSDVADPRIRCGENATVRTDGELWLCEKHASIGGAQPSASSEPGKRGNRPN